MKLLRQPRLAMFFAGGALNAIGTWATLIALWGFAAYRFHSGPDQIALLGLASGGVQAFGRPAATSLPPRIVDDADLLAANSLMGVAEQSAIVFGPLAGSLAINLWGLKGAFFFDAATFAVGLL